MLDYRFWHYFDFQMVLQFRFIGKSHSSTHKHKILNGNRLLYVFYTKLMPPMSNNGSQSRNHDLRIIDIGRMRCLLCVCVCCASQTRLQKCIPEIKFIQWIDISHCATFCWLLQWKKRTAILKKTRTAQYSRFYTVAVYNR